MTPMVLAELELPVPDFIESPDVINLNLYRVLKEVVDPEKLMSWCWHWRIPRQ